MTTQEVKASAIEIFKKSGYSKKDVSLKIESDTNCIEVSIRAKTQDVNLEPLFAALSVLRRVEYCKASGEMLLGCNVFVSKISYMQPLK